MNHGKIEIAPYHVSDFLTWQRQGTLELSPSFQRRAVWPAGAKSMLVDTVVRGMPMPGVFVREIVNVRSMVTKRQVVDGQQRLRTLLCFLEPETVGDLDPDRDIFTVSRQHNRAIAGKGFQELPRDIRASILNYSLAVHTLPAGTSDREVLEVFARMNSTGLRLNQQELRNAEYFGSFKKLSYDLAYEHLENWRELGVFSEQQIARMQEVEETSDALLTILEGMHPKTKSRLDTAYKKYDPEVPRREEVASRFRNVMTQIRDVLGETIASTRFSGKSWFNTLFTLTYDVAYGLGSPLAKRKAKKIPARTKEALELAERLLEEGEIPEDLSKSLRGASTDLAARKRRLAFLRERFDSVVAS